MPRTVVIGAQGHIGSYLIPRLVAAGHEVVAVSRGQAQPYTPHAAWARVEHTILDREVLEKSGAFGSAVAALQPDIVIDNICFAPESAGQLVEAIRGRIQHLIHVGTIWTHGSANVVPSSEDAPKFPFGEYGIKKKACEDYLLHEARQNGLPVTIVHPGHIVGRGWTPLNPSGHFNNKTFMTISRGEKLLLPNFGLETIHHVHADDIARLMLTAIGNWRASTGESFHSVSDQALTLRGFAEAMYRWFGRQPNLEFAPFEVWQKSETTEDAQVTWEHIMRSPNCSMAKARHLLDFQPHYSSLAGVQDSVAWLLDNGRLELPT
jgi:nucleoside-diphosphate-sugar epimerase